MTGPTDPEMGMHPIRRAHMCAHTRTNIHAYADTPYHMYMHTEFKQVCCTLITGQLIL